MKFDPTKAEIKKKLHNTDQEDETLSNMNVSMSHRTYCISYVCVWIYSPDIKELPVEPAVWV